MKEHTVTLLHNGTAVVHYPMKQQRVQIGYGEGNDLVLPTSKVNDSRICIECGPDGKWRSSLMQESCDATVRCYTNMLRHGSRITLGDYEVCFSGPPRASRSSREKKEVQFGMCGSSKPMQNLFAEIEKIAPLQIPVLIEGESGTGKELTAAAIHHQSKRKRYPFVPVNCGALPDSMVEDIFFGHARGAFTGAAESHKGVFEQANGGTLFLDEIGELPLLQQAALLRVLDSRKVKRLGSEIEQDVNFRLVCATNRDLEAMVATGAFRLDLYYRIASFTLYSPSLSERKSDIPILARRFLLDFESEVGRKVLSDDAVRALTKHAWPGNCRQLKNALLKAAIATNTSLIGRKHLPFTSSRHSRGINGILINDLQQKLVECGGNLTAVSRITGIPRSTLWHRLRKAGTV